MQCHKQHPDFNSTFNFSMWTTSVGHDVYRGESTSQDLRFGGMGMHCVKARDSFVANEFKLGVVILNWNREQVYLLSISWMGFSKGSGHEAACCWGRDLELVTRGLLEGVRWWCCFCWHVVHQFPSWPPSGRNGVNDMSADMVVTIELTGWVFLEGEREPQKFCSYMTWYLSCVPTRLHAATISQMTCPLHAQGLVYQPILPQLPSSHACWKVRVKAW